jgi:hypothetical protein
VNGIASQPKQATIIARNLMRSFFLTNLLLLGFSPLLVFAAEDRIALSCQWSVEQFKWGMSGQILDEETFAENDEFVLDKANMTARKGGLDRSTLRAYKLTVHDHVYELKYSDGTNYIDYTFDASSLALTEHRTIFFPQGRMTLVGSGDCAVLAQP